MRTGTRTKRLESGEKALRKAGCEACFFFEVVKLSDGEPACNLPATGLSPGLCSGLRAGETGFRGVQTQSKAGFRPSFRAGLLWFYRGFKTTVYSSRARLKKTPVGFKTPVAAGV